MRTKSLANFSVEVGMWCWILASLDAGSDESYVQAKRRLIWYIYMGNDTLGDRPCLSASDALPMLIVILGRSCIIRLYKYCIFSSSCRSHWLADSSSSKEVSLGAHPTPSS
jgi:hypothetical protein